MKAVVFAGGRGTRLMPQTQELPKGLVPLGGVPILEIILRQLAHHGIEDVVLCVGHLADLIDAHFSRSGFAEAGIRVSLFREERPLGTAGALGQIPDLDATFLAINGDILTSLDFSRMIAYHRQRQALLTVGAHEHRIRLNFGVADFNPDGSLAAYTEKPGMSYWVGMGIYVCEPGVLRYVEQGEALDMPELVNRLLADGHPVTGYRSADYWLDIGDSSHYAEACEQFEKRRDLFLPEDVG
jgi:NDP-sugar pyrophosphorylase family protein